MRKTFVDGCVPQHLICIAHRHRTRTGIMKNGQCLLCGNTRPLVNSHVFPKFAYKRYVSDLSAGGQFVDLKKLRMANAQYKRPWLCEKCDNEVLGGMEGYAAKFCDQLEERPTGTHTYDYRLVQFATSISWRVTRYFIEGHAGRLPDNIKSACRQWKEYLRGKRSQLGPYSQHVFIVFAQGVEFHKGLGGQVFPDENTVFSQIGPLFIVGLFGRGHLDSSEIKVWDHSKLSVTGGQITPVSSWGVGTTITRAFFKRWKNHVSTIEQQARQLRV